MGIRDLNSDKLYRINERIGDYLMHPASIGLVLGILILIYTFPIYYTFIQSLRPSGLIQSNPLVLIPVETLDPIWASYTELWTERDFDHYFSNSIMVALITTVIVMILGTLVGYGFSRFRFPFDDYVFIGILVARLLPPIGLIVPFFRFFQDIGFYNHELALVFTYTYFNLPLVVWILRNYFVSIPRDLDQAAYIDGATRIQTLKDVILPIAKPGIAATAILTFLFSWREFTMALVLTSDPAAVTIPVGATYMIEDVVILWNLLAGAGFMAMLPGLIFVVIFQQHIVSGLTGGAVKG